MERGINKVRFTFVSVSVLYLLLSLFVQDKLISWAGGVVVLITIIFILNGFNFKEY
jgi:hypothetical protein